RTLHGFQQPVELVELYPEISSPLHVKTHSDSNLLPLEMVTQSLIFCAFSIDLMDASISSTLLSFADLTTRFPSSSLSSESSMYFCKNRFSSSSSSSPSSETSSSSSSSSSDSS